MNGKSTKYLFILASLFLILILFICNNEKELNISFKTMCLIGIFIYTYIIFSILYIKKEISMYLIFIVLSFGFFFGQHIVILFNGNHRLYYSILNVNLSLSDCNRASIFILESILFLNVGYIFFSNKANKVNKNININNYLKTNISSVRITGFVLLAISIIPNYLILRDKIGILISSGYSSVIFDSTYYNASGSSIYNIVKIISFLIIPSLLLLLIGFNKTKKMKYIYLLIIMYCCAYLLSGSRISVFLLAVTFVYMKQKFLSPFTKKEVIRYSMYFLFFLLIMSLISALRSKIQSTTEMSQLLLETIKHIVKNNIFLSAFEEMGYTFMATATVLKNCPININFNYGLTYLNSILGVIPNLFWEVHPASINTDSIFKHFLFSDSGMGSSFIAEAYWNFGYFSFIIMILFGTLFAKFENGIEKAIINKELNKLFLYSYIFYIIIFYLRSDTISFWRDFVYYGVIPLIIFYIIRKVKWRNMYSRNLVTI